MAKRGRPRKSPEVRELEGNPGNTPIPAEILDEDMSLPGLRMPTRLTEVERQVWTDTLRAFPDWYFTQADKYLLVAYCRAVARAEKAENTLKTTATVIERANGSKCINPHVAVASSAVDQMVKLADKLGITRDRRRNQGIVPSQMPESDDSLMDGGEQDEFGGLMAPEVFGQIE